MLLCWYYFFYLVHAVFALNKDQIFQNDWQTVNIGVPISSIETNNKIITFSDLGVFAIINSTTGDVLYRYQSELPLSDRSSGLIEHHSNDNQILNFINFESSSKLLLWNISNNHGIINSEFNFDDKIIEVSSRNNYIYLITEHNIVQLDLASKNQISNIYTSIESIQKAKLFTSQLNNVTYVIFEIDDQAYFSSLSDFELKPFHQCSVTSARFHQSEENLLICNNSAVYAFDSFGIEEISNGENMINDKLSANSLSNLPLQSFEIISNDNILIFNDYTINAFNIKALTFVSNSEINIPPSLYDSSYHSFKINNSINGTDINLLIVSSSMVIEYYKNGELLWTNDQSFVKVKDLIIVDSELQSSTIYDEMMLDSSYNILKSYFRRVFHNYNSIFGKYKYNLDDVTRFGMSQKIVMLSENGKINVSKLYKDKNSKLSQRQLIFTPPVNLTKLFELDKNVYALSDDKKIYEIDIVRGKIFPKSEEFVFSNFKYIKKSESEYDVIKVPSLKGEDIYTTFFSKADNTITGQLFYNNEQTETWNFSPSGEKIVSLDKRSYGNYDVSQNALVLPDRSTLYKYLIPNIGIITTLKTVENTKFVKFYIINLVSGQTYGIFEKSVCYKFNESDIHIAFEENFVIFTVPDKFSPLDSQICSIDLFEVLKPDQKLTKNIESLSAFDTPLLPAFSSQCFVIPGLQITGLTISNTKHNIATKTVILRTSFGQIISIPKMIIDGRRNGIIGDFKTMLNPILEIISLNGTDTFSKPQTMSSSIYFSSISSRFSYDPIISINPQSILTHHRKLITSKNHGKTFLTTRPTELESTTYVINVDGDVFVTILRPSGSFDKLTSSFNVKVVIMTIIVLVLSIALIRPKTERIRLLGKWIL